MSASNAGRVAIAGASGSGKSSYVKQLLPKHKRVIIFDPNDEYSRIGAQRCTTIKQVRDAMVKSFGRFFIAYVPPAGKEPRALNSISHLCLFAQRAFKGRRKAPELVMIVEEMNLSFKLHSAEKDAPAFAEICSRGRHSFIHVIGVTQRFAEVAMRFRGNATESVIFRVAAQDLKIAANVANAPVSEMPTQNLHYIHTTDGKRRKGVIKF
jgi:DNA helicase HerA-like ATPase